MNNRTQINMGIFFSKPELEGTSYEEAWAWQAPNSITKAWLQEQFKGWEPEVLQLLEVSVYNLMSGPRSL
jgi:hypothetical protein